MTNACTLNRQDLIRFYENLRDEKPKEFQYYIYTPKKIESVKNELFKQSPPPQKTQQSIVPVAPVFSKGYRPANFESMKIPFVPSIKKAVAAEFDGVVENCIEKILAINKDPNLKGDTSTLLEILNKTKNAIIKSAAAKHSGEESKWRELGLEEWLDKRISAIDLADKVMTLKEINEFNIKFWKDCSTEWMRENKLEKFIPNEPLQKRMDRLSKKMGLDYPDCRIFSACYLNLEKQLQKTSGFPNLILNRHRLVSKPAADDLIMYLDSNNTPFHFAVCLDANRVISKHYELCILKHDIQDEAEGTSYIALRRGGGK